MPSNYPMYIPEDMKPLWRAQARKDGFITLAAWIRWLANNRCMDQVTSGQQIQTMSLAGRPKDLITVCSACLRASCWQGSLYCEYYATAETVQKTREELIKLNRESPAYWKTDQELANE